MSAERELKPCPFCGGEPSVSYGTDHTNKPCPYIECINCAGMGGFAESEQEAKEAWNARSQVDVKEEG